MSMSRITLRLLAFAVFTIAFASLAQAQSTRTWVSGVGDDVNPCSRTAPCKTFSGAMSKTATNGEINCLDPAGFGAVTVSKSITIDCEDTQGGILASGVTGVTVNLTASPDTQKMVRLRGITINGTGSGGKSGIRGVNVSSANTTAVTVHMDEIVIDNFVNEGVLFAAPGGELKMRNCIVQNNGTKGVMVDSLNSTLVHATIESSTIAHNQEGVRAETAARVTVMNSNISNNSLNGAVVLTAGGSAAEMSLYGNNISHNRQWGVLSSSSSGVSTVRLDGNHIINNTGVVGAAGVNCLNGGAMHSRQNNTVAGNTTDVLGCVITPIPNT